MIVYLAYDHEMFVYNDLDNHIDDMDMSMHRVRLMFDMSKITTDSSSSSSSIFCLFYQYIQHRHSNRSNNR